MGVEAGQRGAGEQRVEPDQRVEREQRVEPDQRSEQDQRVEWDQRAERGRRRDGTVLRVTADPTRAATFERQVAVRTGYRVRTARTVGDALGRLDGDGCILAVVTDQDLPDADGVTLLEFVRAERPRLPVLLRTADGSCRPAVRAARIGVTHLLPADTYDGNWEAVTALVSRAVETATPLEHVGRAGTVHTPATAALEGALDGVIVTTGDEATGDEATGDEVRYANRLARERFGVTGGTTLREDWTFEPVAHVAGDLSADGGWEASGGPRPVERLESTVLPGLDGVPVDLTTARIRWEGDPAAMLVIRDPGRSEVAATPGQLAALRDLLDQVRTDLGTLLGGTELLRDRVDGSGRPHLESLLSTARTAVASTEAADRIAGTPLETSVRSPIPLRPALEEAIEDLRATEAAVDVVVDGSVPPVAVAADEALDVVLRSLLRAAVGHDGVETTRVAASLTESGDAVQVRVVAASTTDGVAASTSGHRQAVEHSRGGWSSIAEHLVGTYDGSMDVARNATGEMAWTVTLPRAAERGFPRRGGGEGEGVGDGEGVEEGDGVEEGEGVGS